MIVAGNERNHYIACATQIRSKTAAVDALQVLCQNAAILIPAREIAS